MFSQIAGDARLSGKIVAADPNPRHLVDWRGATVIKPNRAEALLAADFRARDPDAVPPHALDLMRAAAVLLERGETKYVLITLGEKGMILFQKDESPHYSATNPL